MQQYVFQGKQLYGVHCANCHQSDGTGLGKLIPPMDSSFLVNNQALIICAIKHGLQGAIVVNGQTYNGVMPNNPGLRPLEIAEIMTYINNTWGNKSELVSVKKASRLLDSCSN
jgi:mono/diheme cytochrome c family protein